MPRVFVATMPRVFRMRRITQHSEDNTIPNLVHAERPADSEARILEMAQALNIISPEALEPVIKSRDSKVEFSVRCELAALNKWTS